MENEVKKDSVTFSTKCWENDWEIILKDGFLDEMISRNNFDFDSKILVINNVQNRKLVEAAAEDKKTQGIINDYFFVEDYAEQVLKYFDISRKSFKEKNKDGYLYSISELFEIFYARTEYLVHFSGDAILEKKYNWVDKAIKVLHKYNNVAVVNPGWDNKFDEVEKESNRQDENCFFSNGYFSDQSYLIRTKDFKDRIFNEEHPDSDRYPRYGGNLFEKRVDAWMRNNHKKRATLKDISYLHRNWNWLNRKKFILLKGRY